MKQNKCLLVLPGKGLGGTECIIGRLKSYADGSGQPLLEKTVDANNLYMLKKQSDKFLKEKSMKSC